MSKRNNDDGATGCIVMALLAIIAMPIVGIHLLIKGDSGQKVLGVILTVIGFVLWFKFLG